MYEATKIECEKLISGHDYVQEEIDFLEVESDKVRHGIPIDFIVGMAVCNYQSCLQEIRKTQKRWW